MRELRNFTQALIAEELNLSLGGYGKIERDEIDITVIKLKQIAKILGVNVSTLIMEDGQKTQLNKLKKLNDKI